MPGAGGCAPGPSDVVDLFVYVVVLNLAVEYVPIRCISEASTLSLLTAVPPQGRPGGGDSRPRTASSSDYGRPRRRAPRSWPALSLWVVAVGSKLVVLGLVNLVFGDSVSLGGFISVTLLVLALLASRAAVRRLLYDTPTVA